MIANVALDSNTCFRALFLQAYNLRFSLALTICETRALFFASSWSVNLIRVFFMMIYYIS